MFNAIFHICVLRLKTYLLSNLVKGLLTSPFNAPFKTWLLVLIYAAIALALGLGTGLLQVDPINKEWVPLLALVLLISPSLIEEIVFRGLLIPRDVLQRGSLCTALAIGYSTILYVILHPLSALTIRPEAKPIFLDPVFLAIVTLLGLTCGYSYAISKSLWIPILIHWATVVVWVFLLGGHHLVSISG